MVNQHILEDQISNIRNDAFKNIIEAHKEKK